MTTRRLAALMAATAGWVAAAHPLPAPEVSGQRTANITVTPNRPYVAERAKLHFFGPTSVEAGGAKGFENLARFGGIGVAAAENSRYVRLGLKAAKGEKVSMACTVEAKPAGSGDHFQIVGPGLSAQPPLTSTKVTWTFVADITQWHWFTIAATAPWTFRGCVIAPIKT